MENIIIRENMKEYFKTLIRMFVTLNSCFREQNLKNDTIENMIKWLRLPETRLGVECMCSDNFIELVEQYSKDDTFKIK